MRFLGIVTLAVVLATSAADADEGMWTFDHFPSANVGATYGFRPSPEFLDHVRKSSLLVAGNCSASFVSPQGLVMTNEHCAADCIAALSTAQKPFVSAGFYARTPEDETACPDFELDQLTQIDDITAVVARATSGKSGEAGERALRAAEAAARQTCGTDPSIRCEVVSLYHGGIYDLYHYKRYTDVRLAFAPEYGIAQFGGDPDNFTFPRFNYDVALLRAYEHGRPAATPDYLRWSPSGSKPGDLVFVSGNPASTSRELTVAQLEFMRDVRYPIFLPLEAEYRGILERFARESPEAERESKITLQETENDFKANLGEQHALDDPAFFTSKVLEERLLRDKIAQTPALQAAYGSAWSDLERVQALRVRLTPQYNVVNLVESPYWTTLFSDAVAIVRAATERALPAPNACRSTPIKTSAYWRSGSPPRLPSIRISKS